jgi:drug/metabolite transporter (DMT)-like permease
MSAFAPVIDENGVRKCSVLPAGASCAIVSPEAPGRMKPDLLRRREAIALLAAIAVAWGTSWPVIKAILQDLPPMWTTGLRSTIGTAILFAISAFRGTVVLPQRGDVPVVLNIALLHMVAFTGLISVGLQFVPAGRSIVLGYTTPLWVTVGARIFLGETLTTSRTMGLIVGLSGLFFLFDPSTFDWSNHNAVIGNALVLLAALCWAVSILHVRAHKWISTPFQLVPWQALLATCILMFLALVFEGVPHIEWNARLVVLLLYGGAVGIALPYWAMQTVNRGLPAITTALGLLAVPIVGVACSSIALGEPLTFALLAATVLIVGGIAIGLSDPIGRLYRP